MTVDPAGRSTGTRPTSTPDITIVLVCWNNRAYLGPCLDSIDDARTRHSFEIVVVDNGSTDGSQALLRDRFPEVRVIQNDTNVGLGQASNQGIQQTNSRYVLLLNNDTLVKPGAFDALADFLDSHAKAGAVGGRVLNEDGTVQSCYNDFPTLAEEFLIATRIGERIRLGYPAHVDVDEPRRVGWISSACVMLRRAALDEVGMLDESYFIYGDEADLQYRLFKAGWATYYIPTTTIVHFGGRSMNRWSRRKMVNRGKIMFFRKNYGFVRTAALRAMLGVLSLSKLVFWLGGLAVPSVRERAVKELRSNWDVARLCVTNE
jgi:GT2 family glycosyltransferase